MQCHGNLAGAAKAPVLLVQGTGSNPPHNFGWNWEPALDELGIPWCTVALPGNGLLDVQDAGEYVVNAIRTMHREAGRRISIIGHSQGGMLPRWALRFWPDTRTMVDDDIGFAASNHGTTGAEPLCTFSCAAADWQQSDTSSSSRRSTPTRRPSLGFPTPRSTATTTRSSPPIRTTWGAPRSTAAAARSPMWRSRTSARPTPPSTSRSAPRTTSPTTLPSMRSSTQARLTPPGPGERPGNLHTPRAHAGHQPDDLPGRPRLSHRRPGGQHRRRQQINAEPALACYVTASCPQTKGHKY